MANATERTKKSSIYPGARSRRFVARSRDGVKTLVERDARSPDTLESSRHRIPDTKTPPRKARHQVNALVPLHAPARCNSPGLVPVMEPNGETKVYRAEEEPPNKTRAAPYGTPRRPRGTDRRLCERRRRRRRARARVPGVVPPSRVRTGKSRVEERRGAHRRQRGVYRDVRGGAETPRRADLRARMERTKGSAVCVSTIGLARENLYIRFTTQKAVTRKTPR